MLMRLSKRVALSYLQRVSGIKEKKTEEFLKKVITKDFPKYKNKAFIAGGYVRDTYLRDVLKDPKMKGKEPKDIDVMVAVPQGGISLAKDIASKYKLREPVTYPRFGTAKLVMKHVDGKPFIYDNVDLSDVDVEFVASRKEHYTEESRKPEVEYGTPKEDVARRDFTFNTLLKDLTNDEILDLTGEGKKDLEKGVVKTPLDPDETFKEDPLRMLRAIRFTVKYGWDLPKFMIKSIKKNADRLKIISAERIRDELNKILVSGKPVTGIRLLEMTGLLDHIAPEIKALKGVGQNKWHDTDVLGHTLRVLEHIQPDLIKRLSALFHDVGKPAVREVINKAVHFYNHENVSADMVSKILKRLKYPNEIINAVKFNVSQHMRGKDTSRWSDKSVRKFIRDMGDHIEDVLDILEADAAGHAKDKAQMSVENVKRFRERIKNIKEQAPAKKLDSPLNGREIMHLLGIQSGPAIGKAKDFLIDAILENPKLSKAEAELLLIKNRDKFK